MKKILFLAICFLASCSNRQIVSGDVVMRIENAGDTTSSYTTNSQPNEGGFNLERPSFIAKKGLYNIGDTVKFYK